MLTPVGGRLIELWLTIFTLIRKRRARKELPPKSPKPTSCERLLAYAISFEEVAHDIAVFRANGCCCVYRRTCLHLVMCISMPFLPFDVDVQGDGLGNYKVRFSRIRRAQKLWLARNCLQSLTWWLLVGDPLFGCSRILSTDGCRLVGANQSTIAVGFFSLLPESKAVELKIEN
eukprot:5108084-Pleurochrysis_carterae.AAC.1